MSPVIVSPAHETAGCIAGRMNISFHGADHRPIIQTQGKAAFPVVVLL